MKDHHPLQPLFILILVAGLLLPSAGFGILSTSLAAESSVNPALPLQATPTTTPTLTPTTTVTVTPTACVPDQFEPDNADAQANLIATNGVPQRHTFEPASDFDWVKFEAKKNWRYDIWTSNLDPATDTIIFLVDQDGATELAQSDDAPGMGKASFISWQAPASGVYYVRSEEYLLMGGCLGYDISVLGHPPHFLPMILNAVSPPPTATPTATPTTQVCRPTWQTDIDMPDHPKGVAVSGNRLYTGLFDSASLGVINTGGPSYLRTVSTTGRGANGVAVSNGKVYMAHRDSNTLSVFDAADPQTMLKTLPTGNLPFGVAANAARVFVANFDSDTVTIINSLTDQIVATVSVGNQPTLPVAAADRVFVPLYNGGNWSGIRVLSNDGDNLGYVATGNGPFGSAYDATTNRLYVSHRDDHTIAIVNASALSVLDDFMTPGEPFALGINPASQHLFVVGAANDAIYTYAMPSKQHINSLATQAIGDMHGGQGIAVDGNIIYVPIYESDLISVIADNCS